MQREHLPKSRTMSGLSPLSLAFPLAGAFHRRMVDERQQRACIWCGGTKRTREHVVPAWIGRELRQQHPGAQIAARYRLGNDVEARTWEDKDPFSIKVRRFCEECNSGWMSRLETAAQSHLLPLFGGANHTLSTAAQSIVAAWFFKMACVYDVVGPGDFVPSTHREAFFRTHQSPSGVVVHLAPRHVGDELPPVIQQRLRKAQFEGGEIEAYKAVIAIGYVIAQVIGFPGFESVEGTEDMASGATRIWPAVTEIPWPGELHGLTVDDTLADTTVEINIG